MSVDIKTAMKEHTIVSFFGGNKRGTCLQITASTPMRIKDTVLEQIQEEGFIQLTIEETKHLHEALGKFIKERA